MAEKVDLYLSPNAPDMWKGGGTTFTPKPQPTVLPVFKKSAVIVSGDDQTPSIGVDENSIDKLANPAKEINETLKENLEPLLDLFDQYKIESMDIYGVIKELLEGMVESFSTLENDLGEFVDTVNHKMEEDELYDIEERAKEERNRRKGLSDLFENDFNVDGSSPKKSGIPWQDFMTLGGIAATFGALSKGIINLPTAIAMSMTGLFKGVTKSLLTVAAGLEILNLSVDAVNKNAEKRAQYQTDKNNPWLFNLVGDVVGGKDEDTWLDSIGRYGAAAFIGGRVGGLPGAAAGVGVAAATDLLGAQNISDILNTMWTEIRGIGQKLNVIELQNEEIEEQIANVKHDLEVNEKLRNEKSEQIHKLEQEYQLAKKSGNDELAARLNRKIQGLSVDMLRLEANAAIERENLRLLLEQRDWNRAKAAESIPPDPSIEAQRARMQAEEFVIKKKENDDFREAIEPGSSYLYGITDKPPTEDGPQVVPEIERKSNSILYSLGSILDNTSEFFKNFDERWAEFVEWWNTPEMIDGKPARRQLFNDPLVQPTSIFTEPLKPKTIDITNMAKEKNAKESGQFGNMLNGLNKLISNQITNVQNTNVSSKTVISRPPSTINKAFTSYGRGE